MPTNAQETGLHYFGPNSVPITRGITITAGTSATAAAVTGSFLQASSAAPTHVEAQIYVKTADTGGAASFSVGVTTAANELISGALLANADVYLPASNAKGRARITADTPLYFKTGGTPAGTGVVELIYTAYSTNASNTAS